jgi:surface polysaccharide O-acyltransferase-like enzyme
MSHRAPAPTTSALSSQDAPTASGTLGDGLAWVSWLRVLAILGVVLIHVAGLTAIAPDARETAQGQLGIVLDFAARWTVPGFVMLSGALLLDPARYRGPGHFMRRRAARLIPAVVVWNLVYLSFLLITDRKNLDLFRTLELFFTGRLYTALYFLWIVLGLAVVTPVLVPWVASASRRAQIVAGVAAAAIPALTVITVPIRTDVEWKADMSWVETPWTWWIPYIGYYLLGYALRDVVLTGWKLMLAASTAVGGTILLVWQWEKDAGAVGLFERFVPAESYYSPTLVAVTVAVYLCGRALIRPDGLLAVLCRRGPATAGRRLGDSTLGVFAVHLLVLEAVLAMPVIGGADAAGSVSELLARCVFVFVVSYLIALVAARIPGVRRVF